MDRYPFEEVFQEHPDGRLAPLRKISVNGVTFGETVRFSAGLTISGINFHRHKYLDIAGEEKGDVLVIKGFYKNTR